VSFPVSDSVSVALEAVLARCVRMVRSVGARHGLSEADLDDVVQDVRIRLWRSCTTTEQIERLGTSYVYKAATTAALDLIRRRRAHGAELSEFVDDHSNRIAASTAASDEADAHDLEAQVLAALKTLPLSRRTAVRMYLTGYGREEIAGLLGWTEAKTRNLLYRGLDDLRERLNKIGITWPPT
jgi:RNA polymerase sigma-70 factor (ECF subfamily)